MSGMFVEDEVLKGAIASYAFEAMEIASYEILIKAAETAADMETADVCRRILIEERAMLKWLGDELPSLTAEYLRRDAAGVTAKS